MSTPPHQSTLREDARKLNGLINKTTHVRAAWSEQDFNPMLRHQLDAPLLEDLSLVYRSARAALADVPVQTFGELLQHPAPPVAALRMVKDFAKQLHSQARHAYPVDVATVLYFASIAAAELHAHASISNLPKTELHDGYAWALERAWLPPELKRLFDEALHNA